MERAKLGDIEISVVTSESFSNKIYVTEKQVEKGQNVVDHTKKVPYTMELTGVVVGDDAGEKLNKLKKHQENGELIKYVHRNALDNVVIEDITSRHDAKTRNGFTFNILLKNVRIATAKEMEINISPSAGQSKAKAKTQVKPVTDKGLQQPKTKPDPLEKYSKSAVRNMSSPPSPLMSPIDKYMMQTSYRNNRFGR